MGIQCQTQVPYKDHFQGDQFPARIAKNQGGSRFKQPN